jgi:lambda family phage tail tape measure protein
MLAGTAETAGKIIDNAFGGIFSGFINLVDNMLKWVIGQAKANDQIRGAEFERNYGIKNLKSTGGGFYSGTLANGRNVAFREDANHNFYGNPKDGAPQIYDVNSHKALTLKGQREFATSIAQRQRLLLSTGNQAGLPPSTTNTPEKKDPLKGVKDTIDKLNSEASQIMKDANNNDAWTKLNKEINDKTTSFNEALEGLPDKVKGAIPDLKTKFDAAMTAWKDAMLESSVKTFMSESNKTILTYRNQGKDTNLSSLAKDQNSLSTSILEQAFKQPGIARDGASDPRISDFLNRKDSSDILGPNTVSQVVVSANRGPHSLVTSSDSGYNFIDAVKANPQLFKDAAAQSAVIAQLQQGILATLEKQTLEYEKQVKTNRTANDQTLVGNTFFGSNRDRAKSYMQFNQNFNDTHGGSVDFSNMDPSMLKEYNAGLEQIERTYTIMDQYQKNWLNGLAGGIAAYSDQLKNVADNTQQMVQKTMDSLEQSIATSLQKRRLDLRSFRKELAGTLYDQGAKVIMGGLDGQGGITGLLGNGLSAVTGGKFNPFKKPDAKSLAQMTVQANNVYVNGNVAGAGEIGKSLGGLGNAGTSVTGAGGLFTPGLAGNIMGTGDFSNVQLGLPSSLSNITNDVPNLSITPPGGGGMLGGLGSLFSGAMGGIGNLLKGGMGALGGLGSGIGSLFSSGLSFLAGIFHSGGIVGDANAPTRMVDASMFQGARRYHIGGGVGLAPGEMPAILQQGEAVLTKAQQHAMNRNSLNYSPNVTINYHSSGAAGDPSQADPDDIANKVKDAMDAHFNTAIMRAQLPGGLLHGKVSQPQAN